jgi:hypothetical protein
VYVYVCVSVCVCVCVCVCGHALGHLLERERRQRVGLALLGVREEDFCYFRLHLHDARRRRLAFVVGVPQQPQHRRHQRVQRLDFFLGRGIRVNIV